MYYLSAATLVKDEGPYLAEWLAYHRLLGVEHFFLYDNESQEPLREVLAREIQAGLVTVTEMPGKRMQLRAYSHFLREFGHLTYWAACIDLDEFIFPMKLDSLPGLLRPYEKDAALAINWCNFGSSGLTRRPEGLQIEAFKRRAPFDFEKNRWVKLIVRPTVTVGPYMHTHTFIFKAPHRGVNELRGHVSGKGEGYTGATIRLNHYAVRSTNEFLQKMEKGNANSEGFRTWEYFEYFDRDEVEDTSMLRFVPGVKKEMEALRDPRRLGTIKAPVTRS